MNMNNINLQKFYGCDTENIGLFSLKLGYTQGEVSEDFDDFEDAFNAIEHVYWKFTVVEDLTGSIGCDRLLIDWSNEDSFCFSGGDEELADQIASICETSTEDMFGDTIVANAFKTLVMKVLDEDEEGPWMDDIIDTIGGTIDVEFDTQKIPEEKVNSLFCMFGELETDNIEFKDENIIVDGNIIDGDTGFVDEPTIASFSEDVMRY